MAKNVFHVSNSKVKLYRKCRRAYWYRYVEKLRRKRKARPLLFGSIAHTMIEAFINADDPMAVWERDTKEQRKLFRAEREEFEEIASSTRIIMQEYFRNEWPRDKQLTYIRMRGKGAEHTFEVEIADGLVVEGKIDAIATTPNRLRWLTEHKSFSRLPSEDHRWRDVQSNLYTRIIDMIGLKSVDGTCWDYIWSKEPTAPQMLKNQTISKKRIVTLPSVVRETLKQYKLRERDHARLIQMAESNRSIYFQRTFSTAKRKVVDLLWDQFVSTAIEIRDTHGKRRDMTIDRHCDWCDFEPLCRAELTGGDVGFLKNKDYVINEKHEREDPDFEA